MSERLQISLSFPSFGFYGALNLTGDMTAWSFTDKTWPIEGAKAERMVRFTGAKGSETWRFWVSCRAAQICRGCCSIHNTGACNN